VHLLQRGLALQPTKACRTARYMPVRAREGSRDGLPSFHTGCRILRSRATAWRLYWQVGRRPENQAEAVPFCRRFAGRNFVYGETSTGKEPQAEAQIEIFRSVCARLGQFGGAFPQGAVAATRRTRIQDLFFTRKQKRPESPGAYPCEI